MPERNQMLSSGIPRGKNAKLHAVYIEKADAKTAIDCLRRQFGFPPVAGIEFFLITFDGYYEVWQRDSEKED